jgi:flavin-dependent dehydrogenase
LKKCWGFLFLCEQHAEKQSNKSRATQILDRSMADVLISGGGVAGSTLAILLGRRGLQVELFERCHFPREKPCGEGLMPAGVAVLNRLGVGEAVGGAPFYGVRYHVGKHVTEGRFPQTAGLPVFGCGQRRKHLDDVLFRTAANTPGVIAHTGAQVDGPLREDGRVVGIFVDGKPRRAALVVAGDGVHSLLRHKMGLNVPVRRKRFGIRAHFRLAKGHAQVPCVDVFLGPGHELYVTPLPGGEVLVAVLADAQQLGESLERSFRRWLLAEPALAKHLEGAEQITPVLATSPLAAQARSGVAPGFVLLGDAAGFLDPITGGGMTQALMTAELLDRHIPDRVSEDDSWLWKFERARRALLFDYRILTRMVLWLADHPRLGQRLLWSMGALPSFFSHVIGVSGGVRRLVTFPWSRSLDFNALAGVKPVLTPRSSESGSISTG